MTADGVRHSNPLSVERNLSLALERRGSLFKMGRRLTWNEVESRANEIHNGRYKYKKVPYKNLNAVIDIECPIHGIFKQRISVHLGGSGCPICKGENHKSQLYDGAVNDCMLESHSDAWICWLSMLNRCYNPNVHIVMPTYKECSVCPEWHYLSKFKEWFEDPANGYREGYQLDKDLFVKGNKVYSPDTCCFIPNEINVQIRRIQRKSNDLPIGVSFHRERMYRASVRKYSKNIHLGVYNTPEEAFNAYKEAKESYLKEIAYDYYTRGEITKRVYDALMRYEVEITD